MNGQQLLLDLPLSVPAATFDAFVLSEGNRLAYDALHRLSSLPAGGVTLTGGEGVGKSHLLQAAVHARQKAEGEGSAVHLNLDDLLLEQNLGLGDSLEEMLSHHLDRVAACRLVTLDTLERSREIPVLQEVALFLYNAMRARKGHLVAASRSSPAECDWMRPDLRTRLLWGPVIELEQPDEPELEAILARMAQARQVAISPELCRFLQRRLPRSVPDYRQALETLDRAGLQRQRPLTVPLAKSVLGL
ncbi:MAG: hypothetical protein HQL50_08860 [Magnetococcales bacterium]|nr:hypothetical protein [Magnetococcales bacterium]